MTHRNETFMTLYNTYELTPARTTSLMNISARTVYSWLDGTRNVPTGEIERLALIMEYEGKGNAITEAVLYRFKKG